MFGIKRKPSTIAIKWHIINLLLLFPTKWGNVVTMLNFNVAKMLNFNVVSMLRRCGKAITK